MHYHLMMDDCGYVLIHVSLIKGRLKYEDVHEIKEEVEFEEEKGRVNKSALFYTALFYQILFAVLKFGILSSLKKYKIRFFVL